MIHWQLILLLAECLLHGKESLEMRHKFHFASVYEHEYDGEDHVLYFNFRLINSYYNTLSKVLYTNFKISWFKTFKLVGGSCKWHTNIIDPINKTLSQKQVWLPQK